MKNKIIILTVFAGLLLSACSDYLDRKPYTQPNNEDFLKTRENVESYINNLYTSLPAPAQYGIGVRGEEVNSDNILSEIYLRSFLITNSYKVRLIFKRYSMNRYLFSMGIDLLLSDVNR